MKKALCLCLTVSILFGMFCTLSYADDKGRGYTKDFLVKANKYDIDLDGKVTVNEARKVLRVAAGLEEKSGEMNYDFDGDGIVSSIDASQALKASLGLIEVGTLTDEDTVSFLNSQLNWVKTRKPGFTGTSTSTCKSMKVTTTGAPVSSLNVTDTEYVDYVKKMKSLMTLAGMKDDYEKMLKEAEDAYKPQVSNITVDSANSKHYTKFPVNGYSWASKLTADDIKSIGYSVSGGYLTVTATFGKYSYTGETYPTKSSELQNIPYGKIFNLPSITPATGDGNYTLNSLVMHDGKVVIKVDIASGNIVKADYSYAYEMVCSSEKAMDDGDSSTVNMTMKPVSTITESFVINSAD